MVKEQVISIINPSINTSNDQDVAGASRIPVSVRKIKLTLVTNVPEYDFVQSAKTEVLCKAEQGIPHRAVLNGLIKDCGYQYQEFEFEAPLKDTNGGITGEYRIDENRIFSYRKEPTKTFTGLISASPDVQNRQLSIPSESIVIADENDEVIDLIVIEKAKAPTLIASNEGPVEQVVTSPSSNIVEFPSQDQGSDLSNNPYLVTKKAA
jgi:hypothetical protein